MIGSGIAPLKEYHAGYIFEKEKQMGAHMNIVFAKNTLRLIALATTDNETSERA